MQWKKSVLLKKSVRYGNDIFRPVLRRFKKGPTILANSFPKSGTHLMLQILEAFEFRDYGNFLASTPSFSMRELSEITTKARISGLIGGEICPAHLFYTKSYANALKHKGTVHYFIYRDPRDVIVSDCFYLGNMNRWHKLHSYFSRIDDINERIKLSIEGISTDDFYFPDIGSRMGRYTPWIHSNSTCALKFEELRGKGLQRSLERICAFYVAETGIKVDIEGFVTKANELIDPLGSHTYREGGVGKWRDVFNDENLVLFNAMAKKSLADWGYDET